ncbi:hypothetical protein GF420_02355 [candidate division GN15 bacterium]|nr:hypothetical protein [candidate division GN15 bacterium]
MMRLVVRSTPMRVVIMLALVFACGAPDSFGVELTLHEAIDRALGRTSRGSIIQGRLEVAEQTYQARRTNFYFPEISINGELPTYSEVQDYRFYGGLSEKQVIQTTDLGFNSNIRARQSLITGGDLNITANLTRRNEEYPIPNQQGNLVDIDELREEGFFRFELNQPLLKPSDAKNDLNNKKDDLELARIQQIEDETALEKEVIEAYMGVLRLSVAQSLAEDKLRSATLQAEIDSAKFADGIISEEEYLESVSARLDAELELFEAETNAGEQRRQLALLLDMDPQTELNTSQPEVTLAVDQQLRRKYIDNWESSLSVHRARYQYNKADRQAGYSASSHGLNGDLSVSYSFGRGTIDADNRPDDPIRTNSWGVALNFTYPIWDGGASSAEVQAARLEAEQARLEYVSAERSARGEIINLVNRLDVAYRRLDIVRQQIDLAQNRLNIAQSRLSDGQISELTFLESRISYLEAKDKYLEELKNFLLNKAELEGTFVS